MDCCWAGDICSWDPMRAVFGSYVFGALRRFILDIQGPWMSWDYKSILLQPLLGFFLQMLPYAFTIIVLVLDSREAMRKRIGSPAALGSPFIPRAKRPIINFGRLMKEQFTGYQCSLCGHEYNPAEVVYTCPKDGGNLDVLLDYERILRNVKITDITGSNESSLWRYLPILPVGEPGGLGTSLRAAGWTPLFFATGIDEKIWPDPVSG